MNPVHYPYVPQRVDQNKNVYLRYAMLAPVLAVIVCLFVCLSVCHTSVLYQNS